MSVIIFIICFIVTIYIYSDLSKSRYVIHSNNKRNKRQKNLPDKRDIGMEKQVPNSSLKVGSDQGTPLHIKNDENNLSGSVEKIVWDKARNGHLQCWLTLNVDNEEVTLSKYIDYSLKGLIERYQAVGMFDYVHVEYMKKNGYLNIVNMRILRKWLNTF